MLSIKQVVILAAGDGTRLWPLTGTRPKVLSPVLGSTVLEKKLSVLSSFVREAVLIVGAKSEMVKKVVGKSFAGMKITYVEQEKRLGTGHALKQAEPVLEKRFLVLNGDDIYGAQGLARLLKKFPSILVKEVKNISQFGAVLTENGKVKDLIEKPKQPVTDLANIGAYFIPKSVLCFEVEESERGEYEITDYIRKLAEQRDVSYARAEDWVPLSYPWHLLDVNRFFLDKMERAVRGEKEKGAVVKGPVVTEKGSLLKSGSYVEGPAYIGKGVSVGPNAYIRPYSVLRKGVKVGQAVEVKASVLGEGAHAAHLSYIGDSVIGKNCNLGAGTVTANLRFDEETVRTMVKGEMISTNRRKLGAVLGEGVKTGVHTSFMPGVMVGPGKRIMPGSVVQKNVR